MEEASQPSKDVNKGMENLSIGESSSSTFRKKPVIIIVVGMAGIIDFVSLFEFSGF